MEYKLTIQFTNGKHTTHKISEEPNSLGFRTKWYNITDGCLCIQGDKEFLGIHYPLGGIRKFEVEEIKTQIRTKDDDIYGDSNMDIEINSLEHLIKAYKGTPIEAELSARLNAIYTHQDRGIDYDGAMQA